MLFRRITATYSDNHIVSMNSVDRITESLSVKTDSLSSIQPVLKSSMEILSNSLSVRLQSDFPEISTEPECGSEGLSKKL
jgi:hypothetical protein